MTAWTAEDKRRFAASAAPQAIEAHLRDARIAARKAARHVEWLEITLIKRRQELKDGEWPPNEEGRFNA